MGLIERRIYEVERATADEGEGGWGEWLEVDLVSFRLQIGDQNLPSNFRSGLKAIAGTGTIPNYDLELVDAGEEDAAETPRRGRKAPPFRVVITRRVVGPESSYDHLACATALGRATVARAIATLEAAGFLQRQRRFLRIGREGRGPRYAQTSSAYRALLPQRLLGLLPCWRRPAPVPPDALQHATDEAGTVAAMRASLKCCELAGASISGALGRMLARVSAGIDHLERESHHDSEPSSQITDS